ncbi:MAG: NUDIX hydrolase [Pseudomonadota bacterium]
MSDEDFKLIGDWPECDFNVVGFIVQDDLKRVLCQLRDDFDYVEGGGLWTVFGGHHEPPETLLNCAVREMEEELGYEADATDFTPFARFVPKVGTQAYHYYFRYTKPLTPKDIHLDEGAGFGFLHAGQMDTMPFVPSARQVLSYLEKIGEFAS